MELHKTPERTKSGFVLLDQNMRLVKPVNEYLDFQALRGRAENTLLAYGKDLKTFFEFLEQRKLQYDQVTANMIRDYVEYLRAPDVNTVYLFVESKRSPATINRMISTLHGFYGYHVSMYGIVNPVITEDINSPNGIFRGILYHTRKSNYTRQSVFKVKESEYRIHLFTTTEMRQMHDVLPTARDKLLFKFLLQSGARISEALSLRIEDIPVPDISSDISVLRHVKSKGRYRDIYIPTELLQSAQKNSAHRISEREKIRLLQQEIQNLKGDKKMLIEQLVEMEQLKAENKQLKELLSIRKLE